MSINPAQVDSNRIRQLCWNQAVRCFATAYIFERRSNTLKRNLQILTFLGIGMPIFTGSIVLSFGRDIKVLPLIIAVFGLLSVAQSVLSVLSLVAKWEDKLAHSIQSNSFNRTLCLRYRRLAETPPPEDILVTHFNLLEDEYGKQDIEDENQGVTGEERRRGMRAALREFQRRCKACGEIPISMNPSDCGTCGQFRR
jgi:mobilome CxxCx(11)CxxC protein